MKSEYGSFMDFLRDYEGIIVQVAADPPVMGVAAEIKNLRYEKTGGVREVGTPDAIHLASALALDSDQPEAYYNLGFLYYERGDAGRGRGRGRLSLRAGPLQPTGQHDRRERRHQRRRHPHP